MAVVLLCESFVCPCFVFVNSSFKVVCDTRVNNIFVLIGHYVNKVVVRTRHTTKVLKKVVIPNDEGGGLFAGFPPVGMAGNPGSVVIPNDEGGGIP